MVNDIIADMITCIRNANLRKAKTVEIIATNSTISISNILLQEGFIQSLRERQDNTTKMLILTLKYEGRKQKPYITTLKRISKPGLRVYSRYQDIPKVLGGMGIVVVSTSKGIMIDRDARKNKIGGEILCYIW